MSAEAAPAGRDSDAEKRPLVSVVCLTYNHEKFALDAVRSILAQSYAPLDIVILDDASTDATAEIIWAELARHPGRSDIRFLRNPQNLGVFGNSRKALSLARGDFIVGCAGDDIMLPTMVEKMVRVWREADVSLVTANVAYIDEAGNELNRFYADPAGPYIETFEELARYGANALCFGAAMGFERQLYLEFGYPPEYLTTEDIMLPFYAHLAKGGRFIPEPLLKYRVHAHNDSLGRQWERGNAVERLFLEAEMHSVHLAHALLMIEELDRRQAADPSRYDAVARRIRPLLTEQANERASKYVATRIRLSSLGITRLIGANPAAELRSQPAEVA
jgi:glycosyltransferase involved in cell wall biosynthesis